MAGNPKQPQRRSIRLPHHDYTSAGAYFLTICAFRKQCLFGQVHKDGMRLNAIGQIVLEEWRRTEVVRPYLEMDAFVIMPNHLHGIIFIRRDQPVGATRRVASEERANHRFAPTNRPRGPQVGSIGAIVAQFKSVTTKRINQLRHINGASVWQRNYYKHVVRDESDLNMKRNYILTNPSRWAEDEYFAKEHEI